MRPHERPELLQLPELLGGAENRRSLIRRHPPAVRRQILSAGRQRAGNRLANLPAADAAAGKHGHLRSDGDPHTGHGAPTPEELHFKRRLSHAHLLCLSLLVSAVLINLLSLIPI